MKNLSPKPVPVKKSVVKKLSKPVVERPKVDRGKTLLGGRAAKVIIRPQMKTGREVRESTSAVVAWGRMNPPTIGHQRLIETVSELAEKQNANPFLFLSKSTNLRNPLKYSERLELAEAAFGDKVHVIDESDIVDSVTLFKYLAEHDISDVTIVTGQEHAADYRRILETYNDEMFCFKSATVVTLDRANTGPLVETISATQMRNYAVHHNLDGFTAGLPDALKDESLAILEQVAFRIQVQQTLNEQSTLHDRIRGKILKAADA